MRARLLLIPLGVILLSSLTFAQAPRVTAPFPAAQTALVRQAARVLAPQPLVSLQADPAGRLAARRLIREGDHLRDLLLGFYAPAAPGQPPRLLALQWGRETRQPGGCPNGLTALEIRAFLLTWRDGPQQWGALRYAGCLAASSQLAGPPTAEPLPLDDPATVALSRAILERLAAASATDLAPTPRVP